MAKLTFDQFKSQLFDQAKAKGFTDYEAFYSAGEGFSVRVFGGEISEYKNTSSEGVGFRGTFDGKMGYSYTEDLSDEIIPRLLENAIENGSIIESDELEALYPGADKYETVDSYNPALNTVDAKTKIDWATELESYTKTLDPRVKMADYATIASGESTTAIANSHGLNLNRKFNYASAYVIARVEENGAMKSSYQYWHGRDFKDLDFKALAKKSVDVAVSYLGAGPIPSGKYPIIFDQDAAYSLFSTFSSIFMAENGQKGFSLLNKDKVGEVIASPLVTLRDDGITDLSLGSMAFDAEGVPTTNKPVIENGVLKSLLYNLKSAKKDGVASTGNASKAGYGGTITTSVSNFYLVPGEKSYDALVKDMADGVIITELAGLHSGTNAVSGDFSVSAEGYFVKQGKIEKPIDQITVAGNFFDLLKNIQQIGSDLRFHTMGSGGFGMPSILVDGLSIAGL